MHYVEHFVSRCRHIVKKTLKNQCCTALTANPLQANRDSHCIQGRLRATAIILTNQATPAGRQSSKSTCPNQPTEFLPAKSPTTNWPDRNNEKRPIPVGMLYQQRPTIKAVHSPATFLRTWLTLTGEPEMTKTALTIMIAAISVVCIKSASAQEFADDSTLRGEQLFPFDDQDPWKHGWIQVMPFYGGYHSFRPYNYKHVYAQSAQARQWGISPQAPYSQQFWHQYEGRTDLSLSSHMTEYAPNPQVIAPATYQGQPIPGAYTQPSPVNVAPTNMQPQQQQPNGYAPSPQYSGQIWNGSVGR